MKKPIISLVLGIGLATTIFTSGYADTQVEFTEEPNIVYEQSAYNVTSSSLGKKWYYNTGTSLPKIPNYSKYNLSNYINKGDIIYEKMVVLVLQGILPSLREDFMIVLKKYIIIEL